MFADLLLAILHHLAIAALIVLIAVELALLKPGMTSRDLRILTRVDAGYGASAGLVIVIGICRVIWGIKTADFYLNNPWFWTKMASFAVMGLLSVPPTIAILKWRKALQQKQDFLPPNDTVAGLRRFVFLQIALLAIVLASAGAMARYGAF
jgi:putative membrane protein